MLFFARGSKNEELSSEDIQNGLNQAFDKLGIRKKVLIIPPDFTRFHSGAGQITNMAWKYYGNLVTDILPALGTHFAMTEAEITKMFGDIPLSLFRVHDWRNDLTTLGEIPSEFLHEISGGKINYSMLAQVNKLLVEGDFDLILSIGQVVPHEVIGMANYNKNIFIGVGGSDGINKSHFLGAAYGMEKIMGKANTPVRQVLNYATENFGQNMPIVYIQTVISKGDDGKLKMRGLYIGDDIECFNLAAELSLKVNFKMLDHQLKKVVVYLDPEEFKSTWLGNKSIYRTRMAIADGGELIVLAPGLREFGEDPEIDKLIRKYGYFTTPEVLEFIEKNEDIRNNLSAAAHLIHGSSENRFSITYCPGNLSKEEIENVNYQYADLKEMLKIYNPNTLKDGINIMPDGEEIFYISNPALGLWAWKSLFEKNL
ncbi:MAG: lactate racemase domain-containing protein [Bacteroidota bacterium]